MAEPVGERVKQRRGELGLSQRELASDGVSYAYISRIEANRAGRALRHCDCLHRSSAFPSIGSKPARATQAKSSRSLCSVTAGRRYPRARHLSRAASSEPPHLRVRRRRGQAARSAASSNSPSNSSTVRTIPSPLPIATRSPASSGCSLEKWRGRDDFIAAAKLIPILDAAHQTRPHPTRPPDDTPARRPSSLVARHRDLLFARARQSLKCSGGDEGTGVRLFWCPGSISVRTVAQAAVVRVGYGLRRRGEARSLSGVCFGVRGRRASLTHA